MDGAVYPRNWIFNVLPFLRAARSLCFMCIERRSVRAVVFGDREIFSRGVYE